MHTGFAGGFLDTGEEEDIWATYSGIVNILHAVP